MTLTERCTRFKITVKIPNYHADTCFQLLQKLVNQHQSWFKSITFDNGAEFSKLAQIKHTKIYFAHPYSPWERGSNEQCNGLLRQFFPKGQSMADKSIEYIHQAAKAINNKPRKILHYHTANELFHQLIS